MADIKYIHGNPIVVGTSGIEDGAVTLNKLGNDVNVSSIKSDILDLDAVYLSRFSSTYFTHGDYDLTTGMARHNNTYRICTVSPIAFTKQLDIAIADGFRIYVSYVNDGTLSIGAWHTTSFIIPANQSFCMVVARDVDDVSEVADISIFLRKVTFNSATDDIENLLSLTELFINMVDDADILSASGWTNNNGDYSGTTSNLNISFNTKGNYPLRAQPKLNTQYAVSAQAYTEGNQSTSSNAGLRIRVFYTDESYSTINWMNSVTTWQKQTLITDAGKTVSHVKIMAVNAPLNVWHIKEFQIEEGVEATEYVSYQLTAIDKLARRMISDATSEEGRIPDYYDAYLISKISKIREDIKSSTHTLAIGFITDVHIRNNTGHSIKLFKRIAQNVNGLKYILFGGDVCVSAATSLADVEAEGNTWLDMISEYNREYVFQVMGNHDYNGYASGASYELTNAQCMYFARNNLEYAVNRPQGKFYYYVDLVNDNTRIIFIDDYDKNSAEVRRGSYGISQEQYDWVMNVALDCSGKNIIFVSHQTADPTMSNYIATFAPLQALFKALRNKTNLAYHSSIATLDKDFTSDTNTFVCVLCGHSHTDESHVDDNVLTICTNCDSMYSTVSGYDRSVGTVNEQSFDVDVIDTLGRTINCTRIGAGSNRSFSY